MREGPIASVVVVGGGIVGWSAAAALKRHLPSLRVTLLALDPPADALADRLSGTLPSIGGFHDDLGLTAADTLVRTQSAVRLGTQFEGWAPSDYVHAYGHAGAVIGPCAFHIFWLRDANQPFDRFSPAAEAARAGRTGKGEAGLHLTVPRYRQMMRAFAEHLGVEVVGGELTRVELADDGFIAAVHASAQHRLAADLFVDASGPSARLHSALGAAFEDWSPWLLADRLYLCETPATGPAPLVDRNRAIADGWTWAASSAAIATRGFVTSSRYPALPPAAFADAEAIVLRQGRRAAPWLRNCVAIGDAAVAVEPLEWTNLHLAHSAIDRLVAMLPGRDCAPVELAEYNRQSADEARRVRDFLCLHYVAGPAALGPFWRDSAEVELPSSLAHSLSLFRERGRLPFHEEETFDRDSWLSVLLGQGVRPRRIDPLADAVSPTEAKIAFRAIREGIAAHLAGPAQEKVTQ